MTALVTNLESIAARTERIAGLLETVENDRLLKSLSDICHQIHSAWSGSPFGYHSRVYYRNFQTPPAGAQFNAEWGLIDAMYGTVGDWVEYPADLVREHILRMAGCQSLAPINKLGQQANDELQHAKGKILSNLSIALEAGEDSFLVDLKTQTNETKALNASDCASGLLGRRQIFSRDIAAMQQGAQIPTHLAVMGEILAAKSASTACAQIAKIAQHAVSHLQTKERFPKMKKNKSAENESRHVYNIDNFNGILGDVVKSHVEVYDYSSVHDILKNQGVPQSERNVLENIMDEMKRADPRQKPSIIERGKAWIIKNEQFLGASASIVRKVFGLDLPEP